MLTIQMAAQIGIICYYILVKLDSPDGSTYSGHIQIIKFWLILTLQMTAQVEVFYMYM